MSQTKRSGVRRNLTIRGVNQIDFAWFSSASVAVQCYWDHFECACTKTTYSFQSRWLVAEYLPRYMLRGSENNLPLLMSSSKKNCLLLIDIPNCVMMTGINFVLRERSMKLESCSLKQVSNSGVLFFSFTFRLVSPQIRESPARLLIALMLPRFVNAILKDGAYYCYCAYVLRISRYSDFLSRMLTNTGMFLRGLKLSGESRS